MEEEDAEDGRLDWRGGGEKRREGGGARLLPLDVRGSRGSLASTPRVAVMTLSRSIEETLMAAICPIDERPQLLPRARAWRALLFHGGRCRSSRRPTGRCCPSIHRYAR